MECNDCTQNRANRSRWGPGPWQDEPDYDHLVVAGLPCQLHRNSFSSWTGQVGLSKGHKLYEVWSGEEIARQVQVQGKVQMAFWLGGHEYTPPANGHSGTWWVHVDFTMFGQAPADYGPNLPKLRSWQYWSFKDAQTEIGRLAEQLANLS
jgi:hypothetical protein